MSVFLTQWLCPARHCSIAFVWEDSEDKLEDVIQSGEAVYRSGKINRWCGICGAGLTPETGKTRFKTIDEGLSLIHTLEQGNQVARRLLGDRY